VTVAYVSGSEVADGNLSSASVRAFDYDLSLAPGTERILLLRGNYVAGDGGTVGSVAPAITFDGAAMAVKAVALPFNSGGAGLAAGLGFVAAIAVADATTGTKEIEITLGGSGSRAFTAVAIMLTDTNAADADLDYQYSDGFTVDVDISLSATATGVDDMVVAAFWCMGLDSGFSMPVYFTPADYLGDDSYAFGTFADADDFIFPSIDTRGWAALRFQTGLVGAQSLLLQSSEFSPPDSFLEDAAMAAFVIRGFGAAPPTPVVAKSVGVDEDGDLGVVRMSQLSDIKRRLCVPHENVEGRRRC
jgi:hypothetical protein